MSTSALMSPLLTREAFCHAFFTRQGGASRPPFASLSFVLGTGDSPASVEENRRRAAAVLRIKPQHLYYLSQVHGIDAVELKGDEVAEEVIQRRGDITWSRSPEVGCGVRSADCAPILIGDRETGAVAAVHSGWRGTVARVAEAAVRTLCDAVHTHPSALVAAIGPHIEKESFEVGSDVAEQLAACSSAGRSAVLDVPGRENPRVDLRAILRAQLRTAGLSNDAIDDVAGCTVTQSDLFFSYRRDGKVGGRLLSAIAARRP